MTDGALDEQTIHILNERHERIIKRHARLEQDIAEMRKLAKNEDALDRVRAGQDIRDSGGDPSVVSEVEFSRYTLVFSEPKDEGKP